MLKAEDWQESSFRRKELGGGEELGADCQAVEKFNKFHVTLKSIVCGVAQGQWKPPSLCWAGAAALAHLIALIPYTKPGCPSGSFAAAAVVWFDMVRGLAVCCSL